MLVKSFISLDEINEILLWTNTQNIYQNTSKGIYGFYTMLYQLNNVPKCINNIREKCQNIVKGIYQEPVYKDFVNEVFPDGYIQLHTDDTIKGMKHLRCNIMLQKPTDGGILTIAGEKIELEPGDMYVLDTSKIHGVSVVKGDISYKTIVFGFLCNE